VYFYATKSNNTVPLKARCKSNLQIKNLKTTSNEGEGDRRLKYE